MRAVISSTYDDRYLWFIPLATFCWNKLKVDVICFMPQFAEGGFSGYEEWLQRSTLMHNTIQKNNLKCDFNYFKCRDDKAATYSQCSRLYGACLDLPEDEVLITSDVDMLLFKIPPYQGGFTIFGSDLVPPKQYPICYVSAKVKDWRNAFKINSETYQEKLDELLVDRQSESMRSDFWALDQELCFNKINLTQQLNLIPRTNGQNQFSTFRIDRDDHYWRDRLNPNVYDAHLWRPQYEESNFNNLLELLKYFYPSDNFNWLVEYRNSYVSLL